MDNNDFVYFPLDEEQLQEIWKKHKLIIESFILNNKYDNRNIYINEKTVMAIIAKVDQRRKYFMYFHGLDMSEYKEVALICFWYIKLHPICATSKQIAEGEIQNYDSMNEKLAVYYIIATLRGMLRAKELSEMQLDSVPGKYVKELVYSFTYRDISKEALILLIESIAVFIGLDPYDSK